MDTAKVIERKMQSNSGFQMREFLAERVRQSRQAAHLHPHGKVLALDERRADMLRVRATDAHVGYDLLDWAWGVPRFGGSLPVIAEQLNQLSEIYIYSKTFKHSLLVKMKAVSRELDAITEALCQFPTEHLSGVHCALADHERGNQFCVRIHSDKNPLVAKFVRIGAFVNATVFLLHKRPDFVCLNALALQVPHPLAHKAVATFPSQQKHRHDRVTIQARHTLCTANGAAFHKALNRPCREIGLRDHRGPCQSGVRFAESGFAGSAAPTLNPALTEVSEPLAGLVLASTAGHGQSPLDFCGESRHNLFGSGVRLTPRSGLAPQPVSAGSGALIVKVYPLGWTNGYFHRWPVGSEAYGYNDLHCFPPFYRAVFSALRELYLTPKSLPTHQPENYSPFLSSFLFKFFRNESLCSRHNRAQRLRVFLDVEARLLKLFAYFGGIHPILRLAHDFQDCLGQGAGFPLCGLNFLQNVLSVALGNQSRQTAQCSAEFSDAIVKRITLLDRLAKVNQRLLDNLVVVHAHNGVYYHG
jgi:hypothetical protein